MRILHVSGWLAPRYGGSTFVVLRSAATVAALGHEVEVFTTNVDGDGSLDVEIGRPIDFQDVHATFHGLSRPRRFLTSWSLMADLNRRIVQFDVVHIHSLYRFHTIVAAVIAKRQGVPYVIQPHGSLDPWHRAHRARLKDAYHALVEDHVINQAAAIVCTSDREDRSIRDLGYRGQRWVVPVGIDTDALRAPAGIMAGGVPFAADPGVPVITFLGRISAKKGLELVVASFIRTAAEFPTAQLVVAGPDDEGIAASLLPVIEAAGLRERVTFTGTVGGPHKQALLQRSNVFMLPSADESFGIAVAEAMAVGCPVVVSPEVAIADLIRSTGAGMVVRRDAVELSRAVAAILADRGMAAKMGQAGQRLVDSEFTTRGVALRLEAMYRSVLAAGRASTPAARRGDRRESSPLVLDELIVCPICRGDLDRGADSYTCIACSKRYPIVDGIPIMVLEPGDMNHDEIDHHHSRGAGGDDHKAAQAEHFDRDVAEEFEITRPHGTTRLYRFLIREKLRRATGPIGHRIVGATALTVCGGSGMDAEFLARAGAHVVSSDVSLGAARRTQDRARRYGVAITPIVADVEHLPFADRAFELVLVHDGLHHLERPAVGLAEMARTARNWVSVTEPARAAATAVAVRAGLALDREAAGNRVARFAPGEVEDAFRIAGFRIIASERYAMFYGHEPGPASKALSRRALFPIVRAMWRLGNSIVGRAGNKMVVIAEREFS